MSREIPAGPARRRGTYGVIGTALAAFVLLLWTVMRTTDGVSVRPAALIGPVLGLVLLTAIVALLMATFRNVAAMRGLVSLRYFKAYTSDFPAEWIERPARTYKNLLELPVLFYALCALMLATGRFDALQVALAWIFVATRWVHAVIYIAVNHVPARFIAFVCGVITLLAMWARFAQQALG